MAASRIHSTQEGPEKAVLFGAILPGEGTSYEEPLRELERLAEAAGARVVGRLIQHRDKVDPSSYIGHGKVEALGLKARQAGADLLISQNDLSPAQVRNLEKATGVRVVDRTELILDIFARRAKTRQAKVQVELAQLQYLLPRLRRMWPHLERIRGGIGTRGPGEKQIETDRRILRRKITELRRTLAGIERQKQREVASRSDLFTVSLVGYTNAGKTTLLNALTGADAYVADRLFATLDTKTRVWTLQNRDKVLLSDTVGFLRNLPHHLIASFHATLEEAIFADLLLHVVDASHPDATLQIAAVKSVLRELAADTIPTLTVFNKLDRVENMLDVEILKKGNEPYIQISAATGSGVEELGRWVAQFVKRMEKEVLVCYSPSEGQILSRLARVGTIVASGSQNGLMTVRLRLFVRNLPRLRKELRETSARLDELAGPGGGEDLATNPAGPTSGRPSDPTGP